MSPSYSKFENTLNGMNNFMTSSVSCNFIDLFLHVCQIWSEMQSDFLPNFILCNTTQRFIRSSRVVLVQKPFVQPFLPSAKPSFYCGTQVSIPLTAFNGTNVMYRLAHIQTSFTHASLTTYGCYCYITLLGQQDLGTSIHVVLGTT